jgi:type VI secretion system secreted protein VgrG
MLEGERTVELKIQGVQEWGDHLLQVDHASWGEHMSGLFTGSLTLLSDEGETVAAKLPELIGRHAILRVEVAEDLYRYFSGIITSFTQNGVDDQGTSYAVELVPWLWLLGYRRNYRIFQFEAVPAILATIFREWLDDLGDRAFQVDDSRLGDHPVRDYCVQYDETDLGFVERLMEEEGIGYFFQHTEDGHMLVLVEDPSHHQDFALPGPLRLSLSEEREVDSITELRLDQDNLATAHAVSDYHFENPNRAALESSQSTAPFGRTLDEVFVHPAGHAEPFVGKGQDGSERLADEMPNLAKRLVKLRVEGAECAMIRAHGGSLSPLLSAGHLMVVKPEPGDFDTGNARGYYRRIEGQYLLLSVSHQVSGGGHRGAAAFAYSNTFEALPQKVPFVEKLGFLQPLPFRPPRVAEKPRARGPETATVVGPTKDSKEEIWTDKYGRVLVRFFWDRRDQRDEWSSCWVRVAQPWAGQRWGAVFIPRIGQEVIVDFLSGDPDRPIIVGSVYNADQMPPYELPANQTQSGIKTRSSKGGGSANFNELRFEDKKGSEEVYFHAERNLSTVVENDESRNVQHDRTTTIDHDDKLTVKNARTADIMEGADTLTVHKGDRSVTVSTGKALLTVSKSNREVSVPLATYKLDAKTVEISGLQEIKLAVGANSIKIDPTGITIFGTLVKIN